MSSRHKLAAFRPKRHRKIFSQNGRVGRAFAIHYRAARWYACVLDAVVIVLAAVLGNLAYHYVAFGTFPDLERSIGAGLLCAFFHTSIGLLNHSYEPSRLLAPHQQIGRMLGALLLSIVLVTLFLFLLKLKDSYSRGALLCFAGLAVIGLIGGRLLVAQYLHRALDWGLLLGKPTIVVGDAEELRVITPQTLLHRHGMMMVGRVTLSPSVPGDSAEFDALIDLARIRSATAVALALKWGDTQRIEFARQHLRRLPLPVHLLPDHTVGALIELSARNRNSFAIELQREPLTAAELFVKRTFDLVFAACALVLLCPLLVLVAGAIKLDSRGPVIFRQRRQGFNGNIFHIYKFRSMIVLEDGDRIRQAQRNDKRVTRLGRILRRTSIDELPQLFNVLSGHMSLVGPRPHAIAHDDEYGKAIASYAFRQHVKPGITGWAQVNGLRGETASINRMEQRVEHDLWYISNWSFWLDLWILARTCFATLRQPTAY